MLRIMQHHLGGALPVPRIRKPGRHVGRGIPVVQGEGATGYLEANRIAGGKNTGSWLELDLPAVDGIGDVAGFTKEIGRAGDADADKVSLTAGAEPYSLPVKSAWAAEVMA